MKTKYIILTACATLLGVAQANAQGQNLPILTANTDACAAAMGNTSVAAEGMLLYNNPTTIFSLDKRFTADASASLYEKAEGANGTFGLYAATIGYRFAKRHAAFAGFRYAGGLKFKGYDMSGEPTKDYQPYDWTIDLGYTYMIGNGFAAYTTGSIVFSHLSKNATGGAVTIGASYQNHEMTLAHRQASLMIDAKAGAIGSQLDFGNRNKTSLPTYFGVGGILSVDIADKHQVAAALSSRYFFQPADYKTFTASCGLEYTYNHLVSVRTGYEYGDHDLSHFTIGAGIKYKGLRLNGAYLLKTADAGSSYCTIGVGCDF